MGAISTSVRLEQLQADADRCGPAARALFERLISEGKSPEAAAMYACQQAPGLTNTDRAFCQGQQRKMDSMSPLVGGLLHKRAKQAGINTSGKYYMSGLGKATDHAAWVSCAEDVMTVAKARNLTLEGVLNRKGIQKDAVPKPSVPVAPDIVRQLERKALAADPSLRERVGKNKHARRELQEQIVAKHARKKFTRKAKLVP